MDPIERLRAIAIRADLGFNRPVLKELLVKLLALGMVPGVPEHINISEVPLTQIILIEQALQSLLDFYSLQNLGK
jgi:hypothetical protein